MKGLGFCSNWEICMSLRDIGGSYARAGASVLSSAIAEPIAGWKGILSGGSQLAIEEARQKYTYVPDDPQAKQHLADLQYAMEPIGIAAENLNKRFGDTVYEATGSEALAAGATALPEAVLGLGGLRGLSPKASTLNPDIKPSPAQVEKAMVKVLDPFNLQKGKNPLKAEMFIGDKATDVPAKTKQNILAPGQGGVGWRLGPDGKMRFQISDKEAKWAAAPRNTLTTQHPARLELLLDHPELFRQYPDLDKIKVSKTSNPNENGAFRASFGKDGNLKGATIKLKTDRPDEDIMGTLLHEIQHWVQVKEGFSPGSSTKLFKELREKRMEYSTWLTRRMGTYMAARRMLDEGLDAETAYKMADDKTRVSLEVLKDIQKGKRTIEEQFEKVVEAKEKVDILQGLRKSSDGWNYTRTLGEMEARDVSDIYKMQKRGLDISKYTPTISRKMTDVGGNYEGHIIDPAKEALILPPQTANSAKLGTI